MTDVPLLMSLLLLFTMFILLLVPRHSLLLLSSGTAAAIHPFALCCTMLPATLHLSQSVHGTTCRPCTAFMPRRSAAPHTLYARLPLALSAHFTYDLSARHVYRVVWYLPRCTSLVPYKHYTLPLI